MHNSKQTKTINRRIFILCGLKGLMLSAISLKIIKLQTIDHLKYAKMSEKNRVRVSFVPVTRGIITDRKGVTLASNKNSYMLLYDKTKDKKGGGLNKLTEIINLNKSELNRINKIKTGQQIITVVKDVNWRQLTNIENNIEKLNGISILVNKKRYYAYGELASHITGYAGTPGGYSYETPKKQKYYVIGVTGIEKTMNNELNGKPGIVENEVNAQGNNTREINNTPGIKGRNIELSIDIAMQKYAAKLMGGYNGSIVTVEINTGKILTLYSSPSYDANVMSGIINTEDWFKIKNDPTAPMFFRAISDALMPGSTFKPVSALAALEHKIIDPEKQIECKGTLHYGNRNLHCWKQNGHGMTALHNALSESCNAYFYHIGIQMKAEQLYHTSKMLGLTSKTGIEIDGESKGLIPGIESLGAAAMKKRKIGDNINSIIGQGSVQLTALQIAVISARMASGLMVMPTILNNGKTSSFDRLEVSEFNLQLIRAAMHDACNRKYGTAFRGIGGSDMIAGKTGSSQKQNKRNGPINSIFTGYAPFNKPEIAVSIVIEGGNGGGKTAAPRAKQLINYYNKRIK